MSKTIKQVADELGVSKTTIRKQIIQLNLQSDLQKVGNRFMIDESQEALLIKWFSKKSQNENTNHLENQISDLVFTLQVTIETLNGQLEMKDRQIEELLKTIDNLSNALKDYQKIHKEMQLIINQLPSNFTNYSNIQYSQNEQISENDVKEKLQKLFNSKKL